MQYGVDAVSFVYYQPFNPVMSTYNNALNRFLNSAENHTITFSLILQGYHLCNESGRGEFTEDIFAFIQHPKYQRVIDGRPLVYLYDIPTFITNFGSRQNARDGLDSFRSKAVQKNLGKPIVVGLDGHSSYADLEFDAYGSYVSTGVGEEREYPYSYLMKANQASWDYLGRLHKEVILPVSIGWDPRPRLDDPDIGSIYRGTLWYTAPRPEEVTENILAAYRWMLLHPESSALRTILIYAWNEYDEGLCLEPGLFSGPGSIKAVKRARDLISAGVYHV
jgi:hypothetical protein